MRLRCASSATAATTASAAAATTIDDDDADDATTTIAAAIAKAGSSCWRAAWRAMRQAFQGRAAQALGEKRSKNIPGPP